MTAPHLKMTPAFRLRVHLDEAIAIGKMNPKGPDLSYRTANAATMQSIDGFEPKINVTSLVFGVNQATRDPSGEFSRWDIRVIYKTDDGELICMTMTNGIVTHSPEVVAVHTSSPQAATTSFRNIVMVPKFETGDKYKAIENSVFVAAGRYIVEGNELIGEFIISRLDATD